MTELKGFRKMEGVSKKTGNKYSGYILYCEEDQVPPEIRGCLCFEKFVGIDLLNTEPFVGAQVDFRYDFKGYLTAVDLL